MRSSDSTDPLEDPYGLTDTKRGSDAEADANEPRSTTTGSPLTVVAVIDEGVDVNHPDLRGNIWGNADEVPSNGVDDDRAELSQNNMRFLVDGREIVKFSYNASTDRLTYQSARLSAGKHTAGSS